MYFSIHRRFPIGFLATFLLVASCQPAKFSSGGGSKEPSQDTSKPNVQAQDTIAQVGATNPETGAPIVAECPETKQNILILDFKSGWWAGDGGDFFHNILDGLSLNCKTSITLEYHHITIGNNEMTVYPGGQKQKRTSDFNGFNEQNWQNYTQIWMLSGAVGDNLDVRITDGFYTGIQDRIASSGANLFIGSGFGSIYHANALMGRVGLGERYSTNLPQDRILTFTPLIVVKTYVSPVVGAQGDSLWQGVSKIADEVTVTTQLAAGDFIANSSGLQIVGRNDKGQDSIAKTTISGSRSVVLDTGIQRYYAIILPGEVSTLKFLQNIIRHLAN